MTRRTYGWRPDAADPRDRLFTARRRLLGLPKHVDLRAMCSPVEDQGPLGSCTGNASVAALEFLEIRESHDLTGYGDLSRLMAYYNGRQIEGTVRQDAGCQIRDVVKGLAKVGTCAEPLYPYDVRAFKRKPTPAAYADAGKRRITTYQRLHGVDDIRGSLADGFPVIIGFTVYESFESDAVTKSGVVPMPAPGEEQLGGHAVLVVGYDDGAQLLIVRNSYGAGWGLEGYFLMPMAYLRNTRLASDFWTIRK